MPDTCLITLVLAGLHSACFRFRQGIHLLLAAFPVFLATPLVNLGVLLSLLILALLFALPS